MIGCSCVSANCQAYIEIGERNGGLLPIRIHPRDGDHGEVPTVWLNEEDLTTLIRRLTHHE